MDDSGGKDRGARRLAWEVLWGAQSRQAYADLLLSSRFSRDPGLPRVDRALASELVFGTLRWQGSIDLAIGKVCRRPLRKIDPKILVVLRMGAYQILFLSKVPPSAAVNEAVDLTKKLGRSHAASFVNGVLREIVRRGSDLLRTPPSLPPSERISLETSHPLWLVERWIARWGETETRAICDANNEAPPLTLRANTLKIGRDELAECLHQEGVQVRPTRYSPEGIQVLELPASLETLESFQRGLFCVQDEASQLISYWLEPAAGQTILDACAAPGGKSTHLAQLMGDTGRVISADIHERRLGLIRRACERLGISCVEPLRRDLTEPEEIPGEPFDRILLDAPCSGLGVLRRHPEAKWRRTRAQIREMAALQLQLLEALSPRLKPGGILLYSVCTHAREETREVLAAFTGRQQGFRLLTSSSGMPREARALVGEDGVFESFPHRHGMDGFTAFRLEKTES